LFEKDGINRDIKDNDGYTALWWAEKNGHEGVVKILNART
jgi:ankyrin repeat protein